LRQVNGCGGGCFVGWRHHVQRIVYSFMKVKGYCARPAAATGSRTTGPRFTRRACLCACSLDKCGSATPARPRPPMSRRKPLPTTHRLLLGPDFANSTRLHSAPFQRRPVNHSTGPRFHSAPFHRLKSSKTGRPRRCESESHAKSPQPASRASGPLRDFRTHTAPKISLTSAAPGKPLALRLPASPQTTARVSPSRQKSVSATPRARFVFPLSPLSMRVCHVSCPPMNPA
jgi:hypothetical protein